MVPELRARGIGEMLDAAVVLFRARLKRMLFVTALVVVPVQLITTLVLLSAQPTGFSIGITGTPTPQYDASSQAVRLGAALVVGLVSVVSSAFVTAVCTRIVGDAYIDSAESQRTSVGIATRRLPAVVGLSILVALATVAGVFACLVGILIPLTLFSVAIPVLILENTGVFAAMGRSFNLTKQHFMHVLGLIVTAHLLTLIVSGGLTTAIDIWIHAGASTTTAVLAQGLANAVAAVLTTPFVATAIVSLYFDLRIRDEAFDVQLMMNRGAMRAA